MKRLLSFPPISFTLEAFSTYGRCGVAQAAAALSYFLILTLFPLLMCVNYFIGLFHLSLEQLLSGLDQVLPDQALAVMQDYLAYASLNQSPAIVAAALVAIALYFAILKVHPTPFCVMDEIEAALDEANGARFIRYLGKVAGQTQFLLITHRRETMEAADVLYGVTMERQGVSRVLKLDLRQAEELLGSRPA